MLANQERVESANRSIEKAQIALQNGKRSISWDLYHKVCTEHISDKDSDEGKAIFIKSCLNLSQLGFILGTNFHELTIFLSKALEKANHIGDRRSRALINLHLGRLYYFSQRRIEAAESFEKGKKEVQELGDDDILMRSAEFIGLYYFTQGFLEEAYKYFEMGLESFENDKNNKLINVQSPIWAGYSAAYMGKFSRAIGTLDYYRRFCIEKNDLSSAATLRAVLGIVLIMAQKKNEAYHHLEAAKQEAKDCKNPLALYFAGGGLSYHYFDSGQLEKAKENSEKIMNKANEMGIRWQYSSPIFLEMFYSIYMSGNTDIAGINFKDEIEKILKEPNILMRGVALRLRALLSIEDEEDFLKGKKDLKDSRDYLIRSGASIQLGKTLIELSRVALIEGKNEDARNYAVNACKELGGYTKEFYPDDLQYLIRSQKRDIETVAPGKALLNKFMDIIQMLEPATDLDHILDRVVKAVNRLLGAERGGVIWFGKTAKKGPRLRASHNLTETDLAAKEFRSNLATIFDVYKTGEPKLIHNEKGAKKEWPYQGRSMLCIPIFVRKEILGVLYYDNSYVDNCFEMLDAKNLDEISMQLCSFIERLYLLFQKFKERKENSFTPEAPGKFKKIITQCSSMENIIEQSERVAQTDSSVLILGETGVGKELFARHIHKKSNRVSKPFIVIDPSTMPESLVESELFGHEKGAFTGADRQRKGRLEMAHTGTLFIDEVGDIPLSIQVKLLRTLQERTITRIGGTKELVSDFRLIAATHRDLGQMVKDGSFREDLFYRINVVPINIPPLREREDDVIMLARYFLSRYSAKYHNKDLPLSVINESELTDYHWPGNIRELKNIVERTVLLSLEGKLDFDLPKSEHPNGEHPFDDLPTMEEMQKKYIQFVLDKTKGKQSGPDGAAKILGMKRSTLYNRMKKLGIKK